MSDFTTTQAQDLLAGFLESGGTVDSVLAVLAVDHPDILAAAVRTAQQRKDSGK